MSLTQLDNLQTELAIIIESIEFFKDSNYYPSTYSTLVDRYNQIINNQIN